MVVTLHLVHATSQNLLRHHLLPPPPHPLNQVPVTLLLGANQSSCCGCVEQFWLQLSQFRHNLFSTFACMYLVIFKPHETFFSEKNFDSSIMRPCANQNKKNKKKDQLLRHCNPPFRESEILTEVFQPLLGYYRVIHG